MRYLSADVGGTFVDLVLADTEAGVLWVDKVPSTAGSADAILNGIRGLIRTAGIDIAEVDGFAHGFTIATNAWLERRGAKVALLATRGFRDILEIGTQQRPQLYSLVQRGAPPLVPRSCVLEIDERIDSFGKVVRPLEAGEIARAVEETRRLAPDAIAIALLFAHLAPEHEQGLADALEAALPGVPVYLSSTINPQIGEYPRANTVAAAAYVGPAVSRYLTELEAGLGEARLRSPVRLMRSDGGVATPAAARENPATMLLSGPAGGVIAAAALGGAIGTTDLITFDMGGTSADFSLIEGGAPRLSTEREVDGQVLRVEMLDIETISAGGGSIASVDRAGGLHVGPHSAGARPGPACYGRGGTEPTLTDAMLVLGMLDALDFGGGLRLERTAAEGAIESKVAAPLGLTVEDAALSMIAVANAHMRQAIRALSVERGYDIRKFSLLAFGGAGPIFAALMLGDLGVREVLIPPRPGVFAAFGLLLADVAHRAQLPFTGGVEALDPKELRSGLAELHRRLEAMMERDGVPHDRRSFTFSADMRYVGQFHDIPTPLRWPTPEGEWDRSGAAQAFHAAHERAFGHADPAGRVEIVALRGEGSGRLDKPRLNKAPERSEGRPQPCAFRDALLERSMPRRRCPVYLRSALMAGDALRGPAIVSQSDTTALILDGQTGVVDAYGVIHIRSDEA